MHRNFRFLRVCKRCGSTLENTGRAVVRPIIFPSSLPPRNLFFRIIDRFFSNFVVYSKRERGKKRWTFRSRVKVHTLFTFTRCRFVIRETYLRPQVVNGPFLFFDYMIWKKKKTTDNDTWSHFPIIVLQHHTSAYIFQRASTHVRTIAVYYDYEIVLIFAVVIPPPPPSRYDNTPFINWNWAWPK